MLRRFLALFSVGVLCAPAFSQLAPPKAPPENPVTPEKAVLGKILFWDEQLSSDNTVACGTCHRPGHGGAIPQAGLNPGLDGILGTDDDVFGAPGIVASDEQNNYRPHPFFGLEPQVGGRYPPTNIMAAYAVETFWDGRGSSQFVDPQTGQVLIVLGGALESQSVGPPLSDAEMAHQARDWDQIAAKLEASHPLHLATDLPVDVVAALAASPTYPDLFARAFSTPEISAARIAFALATYQRVVIPDQTPFDLGQLTPLQQIGLQIFNSSGRCQLCHSDPTFSNQRYHNIGLRPTVEDIGREAVTGNPVDRGKFKTPSLRNAGLRERFMHNGEFGDMKTVIEYYNDGGRNNDNQDPDIQPLGLTKVEVAVLVDFIENGLTDPRMEAELPPFDRPTLFSERGSEHPRAYGEDSAGSGGLRPLTLARTPANLGNVDFKLGVHAALGGSMALLGVATEMQSVTVNGVPLNIDFSTACLLKLRQLGGVPGLPGAGFATQRFGIPDEPTWAGLSFFTQWLVADPAAPGGIAASQGVEYFLF